MKKIKKKCREKPAKKVFFACFLPFVSGISFFCAISEKKHGHFRVFFKKLCVFQISLVTRHWILNSWLHYHHYSIICHWYYLYIQTSLHLKCIGIFIKKKKTILKKSYDLIKRRRENFLFLLVFFCFDFIRKKEEYLKRRCEKDREEVQREACQKMFSLRVFYHVFQVLAFFVPFQKKKTRLFSCFFKKTLRFSDIPSDASLNFEFLTDTIPPLLDHMSLILSLYSNESSSKMHWYFY